jgi:hypothetical protein
MTSKPAAFAAALLFTGIAAAAGPGGGPSKSAAVQLEPIPGGALKRITLTPKAAERLGIETVAVSEAQLARHQMVSGLVVDRPTGEPLESKIALPGFAGFTQTAGSFAPLPAKTARSQSKAAKAMEGKLLVAVSLSPGEWARLDKEKPALLLPLQTRSEPAKPVLALPSGLDPIEDGKRSMLTVHYTLGAKDAGIAPSRRLRVELPIAGPAEKQKVVPYGAVYYDAKGNAWLYVNPKPLVFERQRITVERVIGEQAVLSEGPAVGTQVVAVGAALLYGTEIFGK